MANRIKTALGRILENNTRPEPVHFHNAGQGHMIVCHDQSCSSPRLDARDARAVRHGDDGDLR